MQCTLLQTCTANPVLFALAMYDLDQDIIPHMPLMVDDGLQVNLPPLLPQLGEVVGAAGKMVGPVTSSLTGLASDTTGKLTDTAGKLAGGGKGLPLQNKEPVEDIWVQDARPQPHLGYISSSQHSVDAENVCSNSSQDEAPKKTPPRGRNRQSRIDWMASLFPSFY